MEISGTLVGFPLLASLFWLPFIFSLSLVWVTICRSFCLFCFLEWRGLSFHLLGVFKDLRVDSGSEEKFADCVCELRM